MAISTPTPAFNDDRRRLFGRHGEPIAFVCEADGEACRATIVLTAEEFDRIRAGEPSRLLCPEHARLDD